MFEILLCSYFGLDHTSSFEIIHTRIDDRQFVILFLCTITDITLTKILSKFQIISKLPAVTSCACLSELPGTEFEGSVVPIIGAAWSTMSETR